MNKITGAGVECQVFAPQRMRLPVNSINSLTVSLPGNPDSFQERKAVLEDSVVYYDAPNTNLSFHVHCYGSKFDYRQYENFQIMTRQGRYPILDVIDDVTTWRPGQEIFYF